MHVQICMFICAYIYVCIYIYTTRVCMYFALAKCQHTDLADFDYETAIYYGDSNVNIGEPFSITCIVPLAEPIFWLKDGEPITRHNLRHGRDEHSYTLSESAIEGEYNHKKKKIIIILIKKLKNKKKKSK